MTKIILFYTAGLILYMISVIFYFIPLPLFPVLLYMIFVILSRPSVASNHRAEKRIGL